MPRKRQSTKSRIVKSAWNLFYKNGYDDTTVEDIITASKTSKGTFYHYFKSKEGLLNTLSYLFDEKYEELSAYQLKTGDVVMGRRGEMGRCAVVPEDGFLCGTGSMLIRTKGEVTADYIQKIISFPSFKKTIEDMAVGQTMPNLNVPIVSGFQIIKPPMEVQDRYYAFAEQVNKSKVEIQKALDKTQMLFDSLMQEYFG